MIILTRDGDVTTLKLNRPQRYNSFVQEMAFDFQKKLDAVALDGTRCLVITGEGKAFSAGQDLNEVTDPEGPEMQRIVADHYNPIIKRIRNLEMPVIAAVNGAAAGAGANIALACDIVVAKTSAYFLQAFSHIGLIPDSGGTYHLPRLIGFQRASALMMLGEKVSASDAELMGMIYKAIPDEDWDEYVRALALRLANMPTRGLALTKMALNMSLSSTLDQQLDIEEELQTTAGQTEDYAEGVKAFLEKRKAIFKGK
ncbi:MAG: enoyl-CoA hydratase/isomerase family protein [Saprospiraceae bacterium]|uniref:Enoyl-CoA hydratase/isomerase family protein n=1 Tax=Candidatus Opimibacter skivensis TaxID=2982028 RepID=A0A9D7SVT4_9BACT|nr:enoyl-CoA hydratase/isomerase family protein [Candidatus Opimibacter skivensis]